jgi:hypothetical protein
MDACIAWRRLIVENGMPPVGDGYAGIEYVQVKIVCI